MESRESTKARILEHLQSGYCLTVLEAVPLFNTIDLRKYISMLRKEGNSIKGEWDTNMMTGKRFKVFSL